MLSRSFSSFCDIVDMPNDEQNYNQKKWEKEKDKLIQINTDLSKQVSTYRKNLDETMNIASNYDSILTQNSNQSKEITKLRLEIQDLQNRLNISLINNQELKKQMETEKCDREGKFIIECEGQLSQQCQKYQKIINQMKCDHANEIQSLKKEIDFYLKYKETLESLYETASLFFNIEISSPKCLMQCIKNCSNVNRIKHDCQTSQRQQKKVVVCQENPCKTPCQFKLKIATLKQQIDDLEYRNKLLLNQNEDLTLNNERLISDLAKQNAQTKLVIFEKETGQVCPNGTTCQNSFEITKQILNLTNELKSLRKQNRLLQKKLSDSILKCKKYEIKYKELITNNQEMEKTYQNRSKDLTKKAQQIIENESKTKEMETSYIRYKNEVSVKDQEIQAMKENLSILNSDLKNQLSKYTDLMKERDQLLNSLQKQKSNYDIIESRLKIEEDKRKQAELNLQQRGIDPNCSNYNGPIPPSIFASSEFPRELQCVLREVGESTSCNLTMKLTNAFSIIAQWYRSRCERLENEFNAEHQSLTLLHSQVDYLLNLLRTMFPEVKINFDLLLTDEATRSLLSDAVSRIHECEAKKAKKRIDSQMSDLFEALNVKEVIELKEEVFQLIKKFEASQKKIKEMRKASKDKEKELEKALKNANNQYDNVSKTCVILENSKTDLQGQIFELEKEKEKIKKQIELNSKEEISRIRDEFEKKMQTLIKEDNDLKKQIQALLEANENLESEKCNLSESLKKMKSKKERLDKDIKFFDENAKQMKEKWKNDKLELQKSYDSLINQTKSASIEMQEKIKALMIKNAQYEDEIANLKANIVELTLKIKKTETQMAAVRSEADRDKKNLQSQLNAQLISMQNEYKRQLDERQLQLDTEKRKIADVLSRNFSAFTDGMKIDINSIESAAQIVKKKVEDAFKREKNLKRSLSSNYDTTSDEGYGYNVSIHRKKTISSRY